MARKSSYKEAYCNEVIEFLAQGYSVEAFAGHIGVAASTIYEWLKKNEDFAEAYEIAQAKATLHWENILLASASSGKGQAALVIFGLCNRSKGAWVQKVVNEHTGKDGGAIEVRDLSTAERARALAAFVAKTKVAK